MFKILVGSKVDELYRNIEEKDKSIMALNKIIQDLRDSEKEECKQGVYCSNCKHSFIAGNPETCFRYGSYQCDLKAKCLNYERR